MSRPKSIINEAGILADYAIAIADRTVHGARVRLAKKYGVQPRRIVEIAVRHDLDSPREWARKNMTAAIAAAKSEPTPIMSVIAAKFRVSAAALRKRLRSRTD